MRKIFSVLLPILLITSWLPIAAAAAQPDFIAPVPGEIVTKFRVGKANWHRGHRGVDLAGQVNEPVRAAASGRVRFVGKIAGVPIISIEHHGIRSTYQPVVANVKTGQQVVKGAVIGHLVSGHQGCKVTACLHWGLISGRRYLDPTPYIRNSPAQAGLQIRLLPTGIKRHYLKLAPIMFGKGKAWSTNSPFLWPARGRPGSPYGMRMHPILGYKRMHWGTDIGASCGSPLIAPADGIVSRRHFSRGHGNHLVLDLGTVNGAHIKVGFSHAMSYLVSAGDRVRKGQLVGYVGTTGLSTGCHLHLEVWENGVHTDPMRWF